MIVSAEKISLKLFIVLSSILLLSGFAAIYSSNYFLLAIIPALLFFYLATVDFKFVFFLMMFSLPLSIEVQFAQHLGTDLPTEPLIVGLMLVSLFFIFGTKKFDKNFLKHPLTTLLLVHVFWLFVSMLYSSDMQVSLKFIAAKFWYLGTFFFLSSLILRTEKSMKTLFICLIAPLVFVVIYTLIRHSMHQFSFHKVNTMMDPFFRNHVNYAIFIAMAIPFLFFAKSNMQTNSGKLFMWSIIGLFFIAVVLSYTRAAWLSLFAAFGYKYFLRLKSVLPVFVLMTALLVSGILYMSHDNRYLQFAPDPKKTIMHEEFGDHLSSTTKLEDISSAERVYRWIAGFRMWEANPITGFGPGNFYNFYKSYTVNKFKTYVSDNPERSTVHNYFLLQLVEGGLVGLLIFISLSLGIFYYGQKIYQATKDKFDRGLALTINLGLLIIYINLMVNDLLEDIKIGTMFFLFISLLVNQDLKNRRLLATEKS